MRLQPTKFLPLVCGEAARLSRRSLAGRRRGFPGSRATILLAVLAVATPWAREAAPDSRHPAADRRIEASAVPPASPRAIDARRLPGEFEPQKAVLLAGTFILEDYPALFADIVSAIRTEVAVYVLVNDDEERERGEEILKMRKIPARNIVFLPLPHDSPWVRDYGPHVVRDAGGFLRLVDARYETPGREADEKAPFGLARLLNLPVDRTALVLEGGNLLTNGAGLFLSTTRLLEFNLTYGLDEARVREEMQGAYGARQIVFLEPVLGEPTGHVDTFATFVSRNTVVLASCDPEKDPLNAELLDRNAARLAGLRTPDGPLTVVRVPTPHLDDGIWRTYTNVLYANRVVLVPVYPTVDFAGRRRVLAVYKACLPGRRIVEIDASEIATSEGALHCMSMNLGPASLPGLEEIRDIRRFESRFSEE